MYQMLLSTNPQDYDYILMRGNVKDLNIKPFKMNQRIEYVYRYIDDSLNNSEENLQRYKYS